MDIYAFLALLPSFNYHNRSFYGIDEVLAIFSSNPNDSRSTCLRKNISCRVGLRGRRYVYAVQVYTSWKVKKGRVRKSYSLFVDRSAIVTAYSDYIVQFPQATPADYLKPSYQPNWDDSDTEELDNDREYLRFTTRTLLMNKSISDQVKACHERIENLTRESIEEAALSKLLRLMAIALDRR